MGFFLIHYRNTYLFLSCSISLVIVGLAPSHPALLPPNKRPTGVEPLPHSSKLAQNSLTLCQDVPTSSQDAENGGIIGVNFDVGSIKRDEHKVHGKKKKVLLSLSILII